MSDPFKPRGGHSTYGGVPEDRIVIGKRKNPKPGPRAAAPFKSALTVDVLACPICTHRDGPHRGSTGNLTLSGNLWPCETCDGVFVENAAFEAMVEQIGKKPWKLAAPSGVVGTRACPACAKAMVMEKLGTVAEVDRCADHGIWFDETELGEALATTSPPEGGVVSWLKNVFFTK